jgi:putative transposase
MLRANRYFLPDYVWHITHRCHKKEFLLKFSRDRQRYQHWLYQARKRYDVEILNYTVTSNHVHLLVRNKSGQNNISSMMQLVAGRTAQEYNIRKKRKGAFWEDRYHATAIETGSYLRRCLIYIDLNMVRAGAVQHPDEWVHGGYHEIQGNRRRKTIVDRIALVDALEIGNADALARSHDEWITNALNSKTLHKQESWSASVAVGSSEYVQKIREGLGVKGKVRTLVENDGCFLLRESVADYSPVFDTEKSVISVK